MYFNFYLNLAWFTDSRFINSIWNRSTLYSDRWGCVSDEFDDFTYTTEILAIPSHYPILWYFNMACYPWFKSRSESTIRIAMQGGGTVELSRNLRFLSSWYRGHLETGLEISTSSSAGSHIPLSTVPAWSLHQSWSCQWVSSLPLLTITHSRD